MAKITAVLYYKEVIKLLNYLYRITITLTKRNISPAIPWNTGWSSFFCKEAPSFENAVLAKGYDAITIITSKMDEPLLKRFKDFGVKMVSTRTVGYDHINLKAAESFGLIFSNATYSPHCVTLETRENDPWKII